MALITIAEIRDLLEGYCIDQSVISDIWIQNRRDNYIIPTIINKILGISVSGNISKTVYINGTNKDIIFLPDRNIIEITEITYVNTESVYTPSLANLELISGEGILKSKYNFAEGYYRTTFPRGTRNIKVTYTMGYSNDDIPDDVNELIGYLTVIEICTWIEGRSGGGNVSSEAFIRKYGSIGKYTNIRRQIAQRCNTMIGNYRSGVI